MTDPIRVARIGSTRRQLLNMTLASAIVAPMVLYPSRRSHAQTVANSTQKETPYLIFARDYGATGDGNTDDTKALQAAIDHAQTIVSGELAHGAVIMLLRGTFKVSSTLIISVSGVSLQGDGPIACVLLRATDYGDTIRISNGGSPSPTGSIQGCNIQGMQFIHSYWAEVAPTRGAAVAIYGGQNCVVADCEAINHYDHFAIYGGSSNIIRDSYVLSYYGHPHWNGGKGRARSCYLVGEMDRPGVVVAPAKIVLSNCGANGGFLGTGYPGSKTTEDFAAVNLSADYGYLITGGEQVELRNCQASNSRIHNLHIEILATQKTDILEPGILGGYYDTAGEASVWLGGPDNDGRAAIINPRIIGTTIKSNSTGSSMDGIEIDGTLRHQGAYPQAVVNLIVSANTISTHQRHGILLGGVQDCVISNNTIVGNNISGGSTAEFSASIVANILHVTSVYRGVIGRNMTLSSLSGKPLLGHQVLPLATGETIGGTGRYNLPYANTPARNMIGIYTPNGSAIVIGPGASNVIVNANRLGGRWDSGETGQTLYGVQIMPGAKDFTISENNVSGNKIAGIADASSVDGRNKRIINNIGYNGNLASRTPPMAPSGTDFYNPYGIPCMVQIVGGTVQSLMVNGTPIRHFTDGIVMLGAGNRLNITYSSAPSWSWWPS